MTRRNRSCRRLARAVATLVTGLYLGTPPDSVALDAFPGAVGHGKDATGGRTGSIYRVTTLADSGSGSFRTAVSSANRIIIFDVGGYITLSSEVAMANNLTIAGQSAPGGGIAIRGAEVSTGSSTNIIIRHVRFRPGSSADSGAHCLNFRGTNGIVDQCSLEFGPWNNVGGVNANQLTIMRSLIADPIGQQFGAHMERLGGNVTWYQNFFANGHNRQPLSKINTVFINNVIYNYEAGYTCGDTSGNFSHDIIGNYFITGPATDTVNNDYYQLGGNQSLYESGNLRDSNEDGVLNGSTTLSGEGTALGAPWSPLTPTIPAVNAQTAFRRNVSTVGAWPRDQVDNVILAEVRTVGTGGPNPLPSSQSVTGLGNSGFGTINGGVTSIDTDNDGMPDYWEAVAGSNPSSADAMVIGGDGYARIEKYLNWLAEPHALTTTNTIIDVDLRQYVLGFTNASPTYYLDQPTNGTVSLVSGYIARFTPTANVSGFGGFRFAVVSSDTLNFTNTVSIIISAIPPPSNLIWRGDGAANTWDVGTTANWDNGTSLTTFTSGDNVTFDDSGSNSPAINLAASITAGTVSVLAEQDYTFGGSGFAGGTKLFKVGAGKLTLNNANTFGGGTLISEGEVQLGDGISLNGSISGGNVTNNDVLIFATPGSVTSSTSVSGSGEVIKRGAGTHTLSGTQTYTNLTRIEAGTLAFTGTPPPGNVTNNGSLRLNLSGAYTYSSVVSGTGNLAINASGQTITLSTANTHTGGSTNVTSNLRITHNNALGTGPLTYLAGTVRVGTGNVVTNTFIFDGTTDLMLDSYGGGTCTWAGDIVPYSGGASFRPGGTDGTLVLTGTGALAGRNFIVPRGTVEIGGNANFSATGSATSVGRNTTQNSSTLRVKQNAVCTFGAFSLGGATAGGGTITLTIQDNASFSTGLNNFDLLNSTATSPRSVLNLNGGTLTVGGFSKTTSSRTNTINFNGGTLKASKDNSAFLNIGGTTSASNLVQAGGAKIDTGGFKISLLAPLHHDPALPAADGGLIKIGPGTLTVTATNTYTGATHVYEGVLVVSGFQNTMLQNTTNLYVAAGAGWIGTGDLPPVLVYSGHKLWGNGYLTNGNGIRIASGGILEPGTNGIGQLTFSNNVILLSGSTNVFELNKSALTNDSIRVFADVSLGGTLIVSNISGTLAAGDSFKLVDAATYSGSFSTVILPSLNAGLVWNTNQLNTAGIISVVNTAPPVFGAAQLLGNDLVMSGSNGPALGNYYVLTSTNVALPMTNWLRVATNQFNGSGQFNLTNPINPGTLQLFYRLQLP